MEPKQEQDKTTLKHPQGIMRNHQPSSLNLDKIRAACLDSTGYVLMAAVLTNEKDSKGFAIINYYYDRSHFPIADVKQTIDEFKKHYKKDWASHG